jgi:Lrp/AsnC family transcriptional regulator for asnA, asnC and gidA
MNKIDKIDQKIVNLLMGDGRMACAEIARRVGGTSERAVRYRINRMIKDGVILVSAIVNPKVIGYAVLADVWLQVESDSIQEVARKMAEYECVSYVAYAIGETDISVQIVAHNNGDAYRFITEIIGKTPGVIKTTTSIIPNVLKDVYQWRIPDSSCIEEEPGE